MSDNPLVAAPVVQPAPAGETLPVPTPDQQQVSDQVFAQSEERHAAANLIGMIGAVHLLHDLAADAFRRPARTEEDSPAEEEEPRRDP